MADGFAAALLEIQIQLHHLAQFLQIGSIHAQRNRLAEKRVGDAFQIGLERNDAVLARLGGVGDDLFDYLLGLLRLFEEDRAQILRGADQGFQRSGYHHRSNGAAQHDHERGDLGNVGELSTLDQQAAQNAASGQQQPSQGGYIRPAGWLLTFAVVCH